MTNIDYDETTSLLKFNDAKGSGFEFKIVSSFSLSSLLKYLEQPEKKIRENAIRYYIAKELEEVYGGSEQINQADTWALKNMPPNLINHFAIEGEISKIGCKLSSQEERGI